MLCLLSSPAWADEAKVGPPERPWALGFTVRSTNIPFATEDKNVTTLIPLIMYEGDRFFFREITGGVKLYDGDDWRISAIGRAHYFDVPEEFQNLLQGDTVDWGLQARYRPWKIGYLDVELMSDAEGHSSTNVRLGQDLESDHWYAMAFAQAGYKTAHYNRYFWGLGMEDADNGIDWTAGINGYYHAWRNLYLQGALLATYLNRGARNVSFVDDDYKLEAFVGFALSNDRDLPRQEALSILPYVRLGHGWATPSALAQIIRFNAEPDPGNNQLSTIFLGWPLTDRIFGLPIDFHLHSGFGWHWNSETQKDSQEIILAIKFSYTIPLPVRVRLGFAEGISWVNAIPSVERNNLEEKGYQPSQLLNYLDPSVELNIGDITPWDLDQWWLGYYIHHRSAIFETAQQFGRIKGGSNFQMISLQYHFF
jgi:outer membrane protein